MIVINQNKNYRRLHGARAKRDTIQNQLRAHDARKKLERLRQSLDGSRGTMILT